MFIGSSIIAVGTALPELVTIIISTMKNKHDLAIGNIIGSNVFNVLLVLGVSSIIRPIPFSSLSVTNFLFVAISIIIVMSLLFNQYIKKKKYVLKRWHGVSLLVLYAAYLAYFFYK